MKTKQLNKNLSILLILAVILMSVFVFSACQKDKFEPKELTAEQGITAFNNAIAKAKAATNIYSDAGNGQFLYVDAEGYYVKAYEDPDEDFYQENWYVYEDFEWIGYYYYSYASGEMENEYKTVMYDDATSATTYIEYFVNREIVTIQEDFDFSNLTAMQTAKNVIELEIVEEDEGYEFGLEIKIVDGYIKNVKMTMTYEGDSEVYQQTYSYNVADKDIPSIPDIEWTLW